MNRKSYSIFIATITVFVIVPIAFSGGVGADTSSSSPLSGDAAVSEHSTLPTQSSLLTHKTDSTTEHSLPYLIFADCGLSASSCSPVIATGNTDSSNPDITANESSQSELHGLEVNVTLIIEERANYVFLTTDLPQKQWDVIENKSAEKEVDPVVYLPQLHYQFDLSFYVDNVTETVETHPENEEMIRVEILYSDFEMNVVPQFQATVVDKSINVRMRTSISTETPGVEYAEYTAKMPSNITASTGGRIDNQNQTVRFSDPPHDAPLGIQSVFNPDIHSSVDGINQSNNATNTTESSDSEGDNPGLSLPVEQDFVVGLLTIAAVFTVAVYAFKRRKQ